MKIIFDQRIMLFEYGGSMHHS